MFWGLELFWSLVFGAWSFSRLRSIENWAAEGLRVMTTRETLGLLRAYESRNITFIDPAGAWPIVWERARGAHVWDAEGKKYLDLTGAFGVAAAGHANPRVVRAGQRQMARLLHAMGDVHPHPLKAQLARELSRITFERWLGTPKSNVQSRKFKVRSPKSLVTSARTIFCNSGFEAVEAALKTAFLATGRPGVIAFNGAYHGVGYGALNTTHRDHFRSPFRAQLRQFARFAPFPTCHAAGTKGTEATGKSALATTERQLLRFFRQHPIGAILVEPIQVRGGINIPPAEFLPLLRHLCDEHGALLILDEIYTGFGRTGKWFACEHSETVPDLICLGKALTGGFPLSVCVGRADLMDQAWPASSGEAIHTSTFLGHPVGCAMALAQIKEIRSLRLVERSARLGSQLLARLSKLAARNPNAGIEARGAGLLAGLEFRTVKSLPATQRALAMIKALLHRGFIFLPEGEFANVISFTPPLTISKSQLDSAVKTIENILTTDEQK